MVTIPIALCTCVCAYMSGWGPDRQFTGYSYKCVCVVCVCMCVRDACQTLVHGDET